MGRGERSLMEGMNFELTLAGYKKREQQKKEAYDVLQSENASLDDKIKAAEALMEAWYWRSAQANHPPYWNYVAMLLNQEEMKDQITPDVYKAMVKKYGKMKGIDHGSIFEGFDDKKKRR